MHLVPYSGAVLLIRKVRKEKDAPPPKSLIAPKEAPIYLSGKFIGGASSDTLCTKPLMAARRSYITLGSAC